MQLNFGSGTAIGKRTDVAFAKPSFLGILTDLEVDIAVTLKELVGAYKMAIDVAPANLKVTGKAKFARIQGASINNLLLGGTETDSAGIDVAVFETQTVAAAVTAATNNTTASGNAVLHFASTPAGVFTGQLIADQTTGSVIPTGAYVLSQTATTVTMSQNATGGGVGNGDTIKFQPGFAVTNAATFTEDLGAFYSGSNNGIQLQPQGATQSLAGGGAYCAISGFYNMSSADAALVIGLYYGYSSTSLVQISMANQLMGTGPVFELMTKQDYFVQGVEKKLVLKLNSCRASKWTMPFKNTDYTMQDFEFTAFADANANWGTLAFTE